MVHESESGVRASIERGATTPVGCQARASGEVTEVFLAHAVDLGGGQDPVEVSVRIFASGQEQPLGTGALAADFYGRLVRNPVYSDIRLQYTAERSGGIEFSVLFDARLNISPRTVEVHRANLLRKLRLRGQSDLVRYAVGRGILTVDG